MSDLLDQLKRVAYVVFDDGWQSKEIAPFVGLEIISLRAKVRTLEAELAKAREALSELERYVSMECYDQWLPEGHAKTSRLSRLIDRIATAIRALSQDKEARE